METTARAMAAVCAGLVLMVGCDDSTTGRRVTLTGVLAANEALSEPFVSERGWTITLESASLSLGALYYFDGEPAFVQSSWRARFGEELATLFWPPTALAHPGHYAAGSALGQMLTPVALTLGRTNQALPEGSGITGAYRSARLVLASGRGDEARDLLANEIASARGTAEKEGQVVHFRLAASAEDISANARDGALDGCVFDEARVRGDGAVTLRVSPSVWFNLVDFTHTETGTTDEPVAFPSGTRARLGFALGVVQLGAYHFSFEAEDPG